MCSFIRINALLVFKCAYIWVRLTEEIKSNITQLNTEHNLELKTEIQGKSA